MIFLSVIVACNPKRKEFYPRGCESDSDSFQCNNDTVSIHCENGFWETIKCSEGCNYDTGKCNDSDNNSGNDTDDPGNVPEEPAGCAENNAGKVYSTDEECGACMICAKGVCQKGCTRDSDCAMTIGLKCNSKLARCLNIYASSKACSEVSCVKGCCYAEKGLTGLKCSQVADPLLCGICGQGEIFDGSTCIVAACSSTTDNCSSINSDAINPPARCYECSAGELICKAKTSKSGCSGGSIIIDTSTCIPSGRECIDNIDTCCSGVPCIEGYCY